jgi:hypothetical protein
MVADANQSFACTLKNMANSGGDNPEKIMIVGQLAG